MARRNIPKRDTTELRDDKTNFLDKQLELDKRSNVYTTEKVNEIIRQLENGEETDMMIFFHGKKELRQSGLIFQLSQEEWNEMLKCSEDCVYFTSKYAKFLTDKGRRTVELRPYQREVLSLMSTEQLNEKLGIFTAVARRIILLQSRQTGKCLIISELAQVGSSKTITNFTEKTLYDIYYENLPKKTLLDKVTHFFLKHNKNNRFNKLIYKLDSIKFRNSDTSEKLIETIPVDFYINSESGPVHVSQFHRTRPFEVYELSLSNGLSLRCADNHLIYSSQNFTETWKFAKDLTTDDYVLADTGWFQVTSVVNTHDIQFMCDLTVDSSSHSYFSSHILSHNTTTTAAFAAWWLCFHTDRNAMIVANKGKTAEEVLNKVMDVVRGLPFWLKPGIVSISKTTVRFENGCSLRCSATSDTPATGDTLHLLIIDECALIPANKIVPFWQSVFPTLSSSDVSQIIVMSTPRGRHNLFYDLYSGAVNGTNGFVQKTVHYYEVPGHDTPEWKAEQIAAFGEANFAQEFELSFDSDASKIVAPKDLKWMNDHKQYYRPVDIYGIPHSVSSKIFWHPDFHPDQLTEQDFITRRFLLQIDTAEGKQEGEKGEEDPDWNIINIYEIEFLDKATIEANRLGYKEVAINDCIRLRQIGIYMDHDFDEEHCAEAARHLVFTLFRNGIQTYAGEIDNCRCNLEINFNGVNWIRKFAKHDLFYSSLILKTFHSQKAKIKEFGFKTVSGKKGKGYWCELGAKRIASGQILITQDHPDVPACSSIQQLEAFGKNKSGVYKGSAMHDDIAVTVLFASNALENEDFISWIEDWFMMLSNMDLPYEFKQILTDVAIMMETYVEQSFTEDEYTTEDYTNLYSSASSGFGQITNSQNSTYSQMMNQHQNSLSSAAMNPMMRQGMGGQMASPYRQNQKMSSPIRRS